MKCVIHYLAGMGDQEAVYVLAGYSVCDDDECIEAVDDSQHATIMNARALNV